MKISEKQILSLFIYILAISSCPSACSMFEEKDKKNMRDLIQEITDQQSTDLIDTMNIQDAENLAYETSKKFANNWM